MQGKNIKVKKEVKFMHKKSPAMQGSLNLSYSMSYFTGSGSSAGATASAGTSAS